MTGRLAMSFCRAVTRLAPVFKSLRTSRGWAFRSMRKCTSVSANRASGLFRSESVHGRAVKFLAGLEHRRRKIWLVRRIGKVLRLKTQPAAKRIFFPAFALDGPVQKIACIELDAGLVGENLQHASAGRFFNARGQSRSGIPFV